jgi:hypothetical protein
MGRVYKEAVVGYFERNPRIFLAKMYKATNSLRKEGHGHISERVLSHIQFLSFTAAQGTEEQFHAVDLATRNRINNLRHQVQSTTIGTESR